MQTVASLLAEHPFFRDLPEEHLPTVAGCGHNVHFRPGEFIFRAGDQANELFLVRHGRVAIEIAAPGRPPIAIQTVGPGEILHIVIHHRACPFRELGRGVPGARRRAGPRGRASVPTRERRRAGP